MILILQINAGVIQTCVISMAEHPGAPVPQSLRRFHLKSLSVLVLRMMTISVTKRTSCVTWFHQKRHNSALRTPSLRLKCT